MKLLQIILFVFLVPLLAPKAYAVSGEQVMVFLQTIGCSALPTGTCEALNADNAKNILSAQKAVLSQRFCGSTNINVAKQLLNSGTATDPEKCGKLLEHIE